MRGIGNPIGVKVSDKMDPNDLVTMIHSFNPENTPGRLAVIVRMGQKKLREKLPQLIEAVERAGQTVTWICDPMHGNTESCGTYKTRRCFTIPSCVVHEQSGLRLAADMMAALLCTAARAAAFQELSQTNNCCRSMYPNPEMQGHWGLQTALF